VLIQDEEVLWEKKKGGVMPTMPVVLAMERRSFTK
jgi:hypothetical protein